MSLWPRVLVALLPLSCSSPAPGPVFPTSASFDDSPREPPSFAAEAGARSLGAELATGGDPESAPGIRIARATLDPEVARAQVTHFFSAVLRESTRDLFPLLSAQASVVSEGNRQPAQAAWRARFAQLDYTSLTGRMIAAPQTLRTYTFESAARAKQDGAPAPASPGEVVVVARPSLSWVGKNRLFGESVAFRLRAKSGAADFEIAEITEDFRLP